MRVTETIKRDQVLGNIQRNAQKLQDLQLEMATGQRITKPSDAGQSKNARHVTRDQFCE